MTAVATATIRELRPRDRDRVAAITAGTGLFKAEEIPVALEVLDAAVAGSPDYTALGAETGGTLAGWICWGPTPCTVGTFDLYWIAVDAAQHNAGIGSLLLAEMERRLAGTARLVVVETAGRDDYAPTRAFYARRGYHVAARIPDFYAPGDDQVVYVKTLTTAAQS
jgi:ribosomal protein S18 acetylase RimI-like enzyme